MILDLTAKDVTLTPDGDADWISGLEEQKQIIRNFLLIFLGTWFDDTTAGVDWLTILAKGYSENGVKAEIRRALLELDFIREVLSVNIGDNENRIAVLTFTVLTTDGTINFSEEVA